MNHSKIIVSISVIVALLFTTTTAFALYCLYRSLTGVSIRGRSDVQTAALLTQMKERLKDARTFKDAEYVLKSLDGIPASVMSPAKTAELKRIYGIGAGAAARDGNFDAGEINRIKSEAVTQIFNFYRQQVVRRNLAVASVLSGVLGEAHSTIMRDQKADVYQTFVRRAKDQVDSINGIANNFSDGREILERVSQLDQTLTTFGNATKQQLLWEKQREELFKSAEGVLSSMMGEISARLDRNIDSLQRDFLLAVFLFLLTAVCVVVATQLGRRKAEAWFVQRANVLVKYLATFGRNDDSDTTRADARFLEEDPDWNTVITEIKRGELAFRSRAAAESALSKCLTYPFIVFSPAKKAVFWNSHASRILEVSARDEVEELSFEEFFKRSVVVRRKENMGDLLQSMAQGKEVCLQFHRRSNNEVIPVEVAIYPLQIGLLKGGFVVVFRDMKDEEKRVSERLLTNYKVVDRIVEALLGSDPMPIADNDLDQVPEQVLPIVEKLKKLRIKIDEREALWNGEVHAVWEQVKKEEEILNKLSAELNNIRAQHEALGNVSNGIAEVERRLRDFVVAVERRVEDGFAHWRRIMQDVEHKAHVAEKAVAYETSVRRITEEMNEWKANFRTSLASVQKCKDWVRVHALNLNVGGAEDQDAFRDRARKFAIAMAEFYDRLEDIEGELQSFISRHPGNGAVPSLEEGVDLKPLMETITRAYESLREDVGSWKKANSEIESLAERLNALTTAAVARKGEIDMLKETCIQVNSTAIQGLERWT